MVYLYWLQVINYWKILLYLKHTSYFWRKKHWCPLLRFRLSNHNLPVETGRWKNAPWDSQIKNIYFCFFGLQKIVTNMFIKMYWVLPPPPPPSPLEFWSVCGPAQWCKRPVLPLTCEGILPLIRKNCLKMTLIRASSILPENTFDTCVVK